jgi:hypothetical protein
VSFETYWLLVPSVGAVILWIGCLVLWLARPRHEADGDKAKADTPAFRFSLRGVGVITPETHVRFHEERQPDLFHSTP